MTETVTIRGDGISLDLLLWRRFGVAGQALLTTTLDLNPGLAACGAILLLGTVVVLPEAPLPAVATDQPVDLFA